MPRFGFSIAALFLGVTFCALALALFVPTVRLANRPDLWVESLAMSADGARVAAILSDGELHVWESSTGKVIADFSIAEPIASVVALSADGRRLAVRPGWSNTSPPGAVAIQLWDVEERRAMASSKPTMGEALALAPAQLLVAACDGDLVKSFLWNEPDQPPSERDLGKNNLSGAALEFSPDGKLLACSSHEWENGTKDSGDSPPSPVNVALYDVEHEKLVTEFEGATGTFGHTSLNFAPDGRRLAVCTSFGFGNGDGWTRKSLEIRDVATGRLTASLRDANGGWWRPSVAFLPDGHTVVVAGDELMVWDSTTQKRLDAATIAFDSIRCVAASREGELFATGGRNVTLWDAVERKPLRTIWGSRVAGPSWLILPGFIGWLMACLALYSRKSAVR